MTDDAGSAYLLAVAEGDSKAMNNFALFLAEPGRLDEAVAMFEDAVDLGDTLAPANLARTHLHDRRGVAAARSVAQRYLDAATPTTYRALAEVYADSGAWMKPSDVLLDRWNQGESALCAEPLAAVA